jgi:hypothetical protein
VAEEEQKEQMAHSPEHGRTENPLTGGIGTLLLLSIVAVKLLRYLDLPILPPVVAGVLPSVFGPAGFLLLIRSSEGWRSRLSLLQTAVLVGLTAMGLELAQLLSRPGVLARVHYTFDALDLGASLLSVVGGYFLARAIATKGTFIPGGDGVVRQRRAT